MLRDTVARWNVPPGPFEYIISGIRKRARFLNLRTSGRGPEVTTRSVLGKRAGHAPHPALSHRHPEFSTELMCLAMGCAVGRLEGACRAATTSISQSTAGPNTLKCIAIALSGQRKKAGCAAPVMAITREAIRRGITDFMETLPFPRLHAPSKSSCGPHNITDEVGTHTGKTLQFDGSVSDDCPDFYVGVPSLGSAGGGFRWASDELLN